LAIPHLICVHREGPGAFEKAGVLHVSVTRFLAALGV
jgi:hypothetical protein